MNVIYGKTKQEFDALGVGIDKVEAMDINYSESRMKDKHGSVAPPETTILADQALRYLDLLDEQNDVDAKESFTFSANGSLHGEHYVEFSDEPITVNDELRPPNKCAVFNSVEWNALVDDPNDNNLRDHMQSITVGSVVEKSIKLQTKEKKGKGKPRERTIKVFKHTGKVGHPPFHLDENNVFNMVGKIGRQNEKKLTKNLSDDQCNDKTPAGLLVEKGHAHLPLGLEELTKAHFIALFAQACCRSHYQVSLSNWDLSTHKGECCNAVEYLVMTHLATEKAHTFAHISKECWASEKWSREFGNKDRTPIAQSCRWLAATLFLSDAMVACLCLGKEYGMKMARDFIKVLEDAHNDATTGYSDKAVIETLGMSHQEFT